METASETLGTPPRLVTIHRVLLAAVAVTGVLAGAATLFWPRAELASAVPFFGAYLLISGVYRTAVAIVVPLAGPSLRWLAGVLGVLVAGAGVYCLATPGAALALFALLLGLGLVSEGAVDILAGVQGVFVPAWLALLSGSVAVAAGAVVVAVQGLGATGFVVVAAVLLIAVSLSTLLTLPRRNSVAST
jgi:uncharacterized membrane protein HdeD (DUF308 family)